MDVQKPGRMNAAETRESGEIVARTATLGDELIVYRCNLDLVKPYKERLFNFAKHRRIEHYQLIATQTEAQPPT